MNVLSFETIPIKKREFVKNKNVKLTKFNDVTGELIPLERLIVVDINLPKKLNEVFDEPDPVSCAWQMDEHDFDELLHGEPVLLLHEVFLNFLEFPVVKVAHDIVVFIVCLVKVLVHF